jgi:hypothetical protein
VVRLRAAPFMFLSGGPTQAQVWAVVEKYLVTWQALLDEGRALGKDGQGWGRANYWEWRENLFI